MPRNSSGTYSLPAGNPVVSGEIIASSWANSTMGDIADSITNSLARNGNGGMTAALRIVDGTQTVPGVGFVTETNSGIFRESAGNVFLVVLGNKIFRLQSTGVSVTGAAAISGNATVGGTLGVTGASTLASLGVTNNATVGGTLGVTGATSLAAVTASGIATAGAALREKQIAVAASNIDLATGNFFSKTISGATTFTVSNVPASGTAAALILDLTNGGSAAITWWSGVKWAAGTAPTLTAAGRDVLGFFTYDGGTTWSGLVLSLDVK